jgi:NADP-reducing hydrogenase subunit HndB
MAENALRAGSSLIEITVFINRGDKTFSLCVEDDGCGMAYDELVLAAVSRYSTKAKGGGFGLPLLRQAALRTGGRFDLKSQKGQGMRVFAEFRADFEDCTAIGKIWESVGQIICLNPQVFLRFNYLSGKDGFSISTDDVAQAVDRAFLARPTVLLKVCELIKTNIEEIDMKGDDIVMKPVANLDELKALRDKFKDQLGMRHDAPDNISVVVGMGTCGMAAGARDVLTAVTKEAGRLNLQNVTVAQTGCAGDCSLEPVLEVIVPGKEAVKYVNVNPEKAVKIINEHVVKGTPVK